MKKVFLFLCAFLLVMSFSGVASALTMTDHVSFHWNRTNPLDALIDYGEGKVGTLESADDYIYWQHEFVFDPPVDVINDATLYLTFKDRDDSWYEVEYAKIWREDASYWSQVDRWDVDTGTYEWDVNVNWLYNNEYEVAVKSTWGDIQLMSSDLEIDYTPVPEPGTIVLMGLGLVGLAGMGRKQLFKK